LTKMREQEKDQEKRSNYLRKKSVLHIECRPYTDFLRVIILGFFFLQKKLKLLEKDIGSDVNEIGWILPQIRSGRSRIRIISIRL